MRLNDSMIDGFLSELHKLAGLAAAVDRYLGESSANENEKRSMLEQERQRRDNRAQGSIIEQPGLPPGQGLPSLGENQNFTSEAYMPSNEGYGG